MSIALYYKNEHPPTLYDNFIETAEESSIAIPTEKTQEKTHEKPQRKTRDQRVLIDSDEYILDKDRFYEENNKCSLINSQNRLLMNSMIDFYTENEKLNRMILIINGDSKISLRIVDWFVTNYAKKHYIIYDLPDASRFKVYNDYKLKLKAYSKKRFDPFCRWERTMIPLQQNRYIETTIGQLNFFKWAIENLVIDYIEENYKDIEYDMNLRNSTSKKKSNNSESSATYSSSTSSTNYSISSISSDELNPILNNKTRKKREELSVSACKCIKKEEISVVVKFT